MKLVKEEEMEKLRERAREAAEEKVLDALGYGGGLRPGVPQRACRACAGRASRSTPQAAGGRERARAQLRAGTLDDEQVEVEVAGAGHAR